MRCEVIAVGTELLLGQIVDTNSSWIGENLAAAGIDSHFQTKVGDNAQRIASSLEHALSRSEAVVMCGGLGPTQDDITRDVIASVMGVDLIRDHDIEDKIEAMFRSRGRDMPLNNLRQADVPRGATTMAQQPGTAPGLVCPIGDKVVYAVPGVPSEMRAMVLGTVLPDLRARSGETATIGSRVLRTWGHSESGLAELLADRIVELDDGGKATIAFLASGPEGLKVRVTAKARDEVELADILESEEAVLRALLGDLVFGLDDDTMESVTLGLIEARGQTLGVVEVASGGYLTARLAGHDVASTVLRGSIIAPNPQSVDEIGGGDSTAAGLARAARERFGSSVGLAVGRAVSNGSRGVDVELAWTAGDRARSWSVSLPDDRERIRQFSGITLLNDLRLHLLP